MPKELLQAKHYKRKIVTLIFLTLSSQRTNKSWVWMIILKSLGTEYRQLLESFVIITIQIIIQIFSSIPFSATSRKSWWDPVAGKKQHKKSVYCY